MATAFQLRQMQGITSREKQSKACLCDGWENVGLNYRRKSVLIDKDLKFHKQTAAVVKKANSVLGIIKRAFGKHDEKTLPLLFKTSVRPHLEYGNVVWGPLFQEDIKAIERVQRRATKMVPGLCDMTHKE